MRQQLLKQSDVSLVIKALELTHFHDLPELLQVCIPIVKSHLTELQDHEEWSRLKELGVVEKVLEAGEPLKHVDPIPDDGYYYRLEEMVTKLSQDFKALFAAVFEGNGGFAADIV